MAFATRQTMVLVYPLAMTAWEPNPDRKRSATSFCFGVQASPLLDMATKFQGQTQGQFQDNFRVISKYSFKVDDCQGFRTAWRTLPEANKI